MWASHFLLDFFTGIWPIYKTMMQIDLAKAGLIAGLSGFIGEILQLFFGYFSDRGHRKKIMILGLIFASSILWITFVDGLFSSFCFLLLLMLGSGSYHPAAVGSAGNITRQYKGRSILLFASGGAIGLAVSQLGFIQLMHLFNGHALVMLLPVAVMIIIIGFHRFPEVEQTKAQLSFKEFIQPILRCQKPLLLLYLAQVANYSLYIAFIFLLPDLLISKGCHSWLCHGGGHLCFIFGSAIALPPVGYLCDRYGQKSVMLAVISMAIFLLYFFIMQPLLSMEWTIFLLASLGGFMGLVNPILVSWGNRLVPENPSTVSALMMGFAWCVASLGATWAGLIAKVYDTDPIVKTIFWMGLLLVVALLFILMMPQPALHEEVAEE